VIGKVAASADRLEGEQSPGRVFDGERRF